MSLPNLPYEDTLRREVRTEWGGLNLNENAEGGDLIEAMNMSSREYPLLATAAEPIPVYSRRDGIYNPVLYDKLYWVERELPSYYFTYDGADPAHDESRKLNDTAVYGMLRYGAMNGKIFMMPHKQYYDTETDTVKDMEASYTASAGRVEFRDGTYAGVPAKANTLVCLDVNWASYFKAGDAVKISGCEGTRNNGTFIIREISGHELRFYENTFDPDLWYHQGYFEDTAGVYAFTANGETYKFNMSAANVGMLWYMYYSVGDNKIELMRPNGDGSYRVERINIITTADEPVFTFTLDQYVFEVGSVTIERKVPDMRFLCVNGNRLWGCKGDTIYASALGNPMNFNVFDGLSTDSWTAETGTVGDFTGCATFQGYPVFFKENAVFRVYGDTPQNFSLRKQNISGVATGCDLSLAEIRGRLYYRSTTGILSWDGGDYPSVISAPLGIDFQEIILIDPDGGERLKWNGGRAGSDGDRYYLDIEERPRLGEQIYHLYTYDTRFGVWHELTTPGLSMGEYAGNGSKVYRVTLFAVESEHYYRYVVYRLPGRLQDIGYRPWTATFADSTRAYKTVLTGSEGKKGILRLLIRCKVTGSMTVWIAYDGGDFEEVKTIGGDDEPKDTYVVPLILRRCDRWQLRLTGTQTAVIYSIAVERYGGEWQQAE